MALDLPDGEPCLVDANIFYYHFVEIPSLSEPCSDFLERVAQGVIVAFTSVHLLAEAMHKIMLAEAVARFAPARASLVNWLQANRHRISELEDYRAEIRELCAMSVTFLSFQSELIPRAAETAKELMLLTNDAITITLMRDHRLKHLVTNDDDFDDVSGVTVWKPR